MKIVNVTKSQLEEVSHLYIKIYDKLLPEERFTFKTALEYIRYNYKKEKKLFLVAVNENKKVIGFVFGYIRPYNDGLHLMAEELGVDNDYQQQGIAKKLILKFITKAKKMGKISQVRGVTFSSNNGMPYSWYERICLTKIEYMFMIAGNPEVILKNIKKT